MEVELRILCTNKIGHCIKNYFRSKSNIEYYLEMEIREKLEEMEAVYDYLRIQYTKSGCIATAYNV